MTYLIFYDEENICKVEGCTRPMVNLFHKICLEHSKDKETYPDCDAKTCEKRFLNGTKWLCPHNTLYEKRQDICNEWDFEENEKIGLYPHKIPRATRKKASWICSKNNAHRWKTEIANRTIRGDRCPYCVRRWVSPGQSLADTHPHLVKEFHPTKNGTTTAYDILSGTIVLFWWKCSAEDICECHEWQASPNDRTRKDTPHGCPYCCISPKLCPHNNLSVRFPEIAAEWDIEKNGCTPNLIMPGDNRHAHWICGVCDYHWSSQINSRCKYGGGNNCPQCSSSKGETKIQTIFERLNIEFKLQYILEELPRKKFDFFIKYNNKRILLEYDGMQHFYYVSFFHKNADKFIERRNIDILKTKTALENNYYLIRIDFEELNNIEHIREALQYFQTTPNWLYLSNTTTYDWLIDALENW